MSFKNQLREDRKNKSPKINAVSHIEDQNCKGCVARIMSKLETEFNVSLEWNSQLKLVDVINHLKTAFPTISFSQKVKATSFMSPDGGILYLVDNKGNSYPILIGEVKNQGTNDLRKAEGKKKQAQGNAIERLGKNVIGFRTYMMDTDIFPFVCFCDGCDFAEDSSILDRVVTIAMFGELNTDHTSNASYQKAVFNRGSYYCREKKWKPEEMETIMYEVAKKAIYYYFSKYGDKDFLNSKRLTLL